MNFMPQCHICCEYKNDGRFDLDELTGMLHPECQACYDQWVVQISEYEEFCEKQMIRSD